MCQGRSARDFINALTFTMAGYYIDMGLDGWEADVSKARIALLWDESFLWALMAYKSFNKLGLAPDIVTSDDVREGALEGYDVLFVPGGWASDKTVRLGADGAEAVRSFVREGGSYMGFCGGAGLALDVQGGLSLTRVSRVPTSHRVPSFSGKINLVPSLPAHPIWSGIRPPYSFTAWWPGQFHIAVAEGVRVVASYAGPGRDFCLADLPSSDVEGYDEGWAKWEAGYGINLDPVRLMGEPAIIETLYGKGKVFLSYLHLETPGDKKGNRALLNVVEYLKPQRRAVKRKGRGTRVRYPADARALKAADEMMRAAKEFITFGERNVLWYWRNPWMLQWRRGVRGVEYSMLYGLVKEVAGGLKAHGGSTDPALSGKVIAVRERVIPFFEDAKRLLMKERFALMNGGMSSIHSHDPDVKALRERLFSGSKRLGGEFKEILDALDEVVRGVL